MSSMLDYESPATRQRWRLPLLKIALVMGLLPLTTGVLIFVLWLATRDERLEIAGLVTIVLGSACFLIGAIALLIQAIQTWLTRRERQDCRRQSIRIALGGLLLVANFPVCCAIIRVVSTLQSQYVINVLNESSQPAHSVLVTHGGKTFQLGNLLPRTQATFKLIPEGAPLQISLTQNGTRRQSVPVAYLYDDDNVSSSRSVTIVIDDDAVVAR